MGTWPLGIRIVQDSGMTGENKIATSLPACTRCGRLVRRNLVSYETFEQMHWACLHYEFEHKGGEGDHDEPCRDPRCTARAFDDKPPPPWEPRTPGS